MTVRLYQSTDAGAPPVPGSVASAAGSIIAILDACLVNGYGSKVAAGWSKPFSGTNIAAYMQGGGSNRLFRINDTSTASYRPCDIRMFESMTTINDGVGESPATSSTSNFYAAHTTYSSMSWNVIADETAFYMSLESSNNSNQNILFFGDANTINSADVNCTLIVSSSNSSSVTASGYGNLSDVANSIGSGNAGFYAIRPYDGSFGYVNVGKHTDSAKNNNVASMGNGSMSYPNPPDAGTYFSPIWVHEPSTVILRGTMPGAWSPCHNKSNFANASIITATGDLVGKQLMFLKSGAGLLAIEVSDTWR